MVILALEDLGLDQDLEQLKVEDTLVCYPQLALDRELANKNVLKNVIFKIT